jgi:hypothetical protein
MLPCRPEGPPITVDPAVDVAPTPTGTPNTTAVDEAVRSDDPGHVRMVVGVWLLVLGFAAITAYWSHHVGVPLRDPEGKMFRARLANALVVFAVLAVADGALRARRAGWPLRRTPTMLRLRWPVDRLALAVSGLVAYHAVYICYRNLKSWDAFNTLQDDALLRLDRWLFFGNSPAVLLHNMLGEQAAAYPLETVYRAFTYLVPLSLIAALVFVDRLREGYVFLASAMWIWILGTGAYYLIPSLGPFAAAPQEFAGLPHTKITDTQAEYLASRAHILADRGAPDAFNSISAWASLHVGFVTLIVLMLHYYGKRLAAALMALYLLTVVLATIYFGWHYVTDDIAGVLMAVLAVRLGRWMIGRQPDPTPPATAG